MRGFPVVLSVATRYLATDERYLELGDQLADATPVEAEMLSYEELTLRFRRFAYGSLLRVLTRIKPSVVDRQLRDELVTNAELAYAVLGIEPDDGGLSLELNS